MSSSWNGFMDIRGTRRAQRFLSVATYGSGGLTSHSSCTKSTGKSTTGIDGLQWQVFAIEIGTGFRGEAGRIDPRWECIDATEMITMLHILRAEVLSLLGQRLSKGY